jgi:very-short-patch-repair endonuclease
VHGYKPSHAKSELERLLHELVRGAALPAPDYNVLVQGERYMHEVDGHWPQHGLVVECDGYAWHRTRRDHKRDAAKRADLELAGYRVTTLNWEDLTMHRDRTLRRLRATLGVKPLTRDQAPVRRSPTRA